MRIVALVGLVLLVSACGRTPERANVTSPCEAEFRQGEFGSNVAVLATMSGPPAVGEEASLTVGVCAKKDTRAVVSVKLPDGFAWRTPPAGTTVTETPGPYGGCDTTASGEWDLVAMTPVRLSGTVAATKEGPAELGAFVQPGEPGPGGAAYVRLTVGADESRWGYPDLSGDASATSATPKPGC